MQALVLHTLSDSPPERDMQTRACPSMLLDPSPLASLHWMPTPLIWLRLQYDLRLAAGVTDSSHSMRIDAVPKLRLGTANSYSIPQHHCIISYMHAVAAAAGGASASCTKLNACSVTAKVFVCRNMPLNTARGSRQMLFDDETRDNSFDMEVDWIRVSHTW